MRIAGRKMDYIERADMKHRKTFEAVEYEVSVL
jgi:hypothetical protein